LDDYIPEDRWNIAIAMRHGDVELKKHVDRALNEIIQQGIVATALKRYHTPYLEPFDSPTEKNKQSPVQPTSKTGSTNVRSSGVIAPPIERGLEPQMARRQRSKQSYHGLNLVRSRGTLIVGLDQNNLPFSTAHPRPAGLDYEIAKLLAKQLGVSLQVYWAYSSHDSYPSKLANKKLCDAILGVMPDDRFSGEVSFSEPYYDANYQFVLAAREKTADLDSAIVNEPVAIEVGVVAKGLQDQKLREYPSLNAVLAAIAEGHEKIGYVIAPRAHWLAQQNWPNQLQFVRPRSTVDHFPICAAVRHEDSDLKAALNDALERLHQSGQLDEVFVRWHVPLDRFPTSIGPVK
jgi:ABC-type amino acid transport substrate-binding protein